MAFSGHPDWRMPMQVGQRLAYAAWDRPGAFRLPPVCLRAGVPGDSAPLRLDIFRQDRDAAGLAHYGLLSLALAADFELDAARRAAFEADQPATLAPLQIEAGWLRLSPMDALELPAAAEGLLPLDAAGLGALSLSLRLDGAAADLFEAALQRGQWALGARAWLRARGVAERAPMAVEFDPAELAAALAAFDRDGQGVDCERLRQRLADAPRDLGLHLSGDAAAVPPQAVAEALLDRIAARHGQLRPPSDGEGARLQLDLPSLAPGRVRWALDAPVLAPRLFAIQADPLGALGELDPAQIAREVVRRHTVRALPSGWRSVTVRPNLPDRRIGVAATQVELQMPARPPARASTLKAAAVLASAQAPVRLDLRLSPNEALDYSYRTAVVLIDGVRAETIKGPLRRSGREVLTLGPDDFGVSWLPVDAEPALLAEADIEVECSGNRAGRPWSARGRLDSAAGALAFALPPDLRDAVLRASAHSHASAQRRAMAPAPAEPLRLDAFCFEGAGVRELAVEAEFDRPMPQLLLELAPQDAADTPASRRSLRLTPSAPRAYWRWLSMSPFRGGYRWRWSPRSPWSEVLQPDQPLRLRSSQIPQADKEVVE